VRSDPPGPGPDAGPHVFVDDLDRPALASEDHHHLSRVLRVRPGDPLTVSDGRGGWRSCRFGDPPVPEGPVIEVPAPEPALTIGFALVKGGRPELVVQKLTELGIERIMPFLAERSVVRWETERGRRHVERLRKVAREAAMQSRRCRLPDVTEVGRFADLVANDRGAVALAERGGQPPSLLCRTVLIGPEGGWSQAELALSVPMIALGDQILRAETAAITAAGVLTALRSGLVRKAD
jgi:16S rRNA (uracil1498-N3)-methyltransferase